MHKVELMTQAPTTCLTCGRGNTPDDPHGMDDFWAIDLERDVNWGDPTYLCRYCVDEVALIGGFVTDGQLEEANDTAESLRKELHDLKAEFDSYRRRARTILAGKKAQRSIVEEEKPATAVKKKAPVKKAAA